MRDVKYQMVYTVHGIIRKINMHKQLCGVYSIPTNFFLCSLSKYLQERAFDEVNNNHKYKRSVYTMGAIKEK